MSTGTTISSEFDLRMLVADIFGDLAFLIAEQDACAVDANAKWLHGAVTYCGPHSGTLECWTTDKFARGLAANMLGVDLADEPVAGAATDALCELMNVLCGNLVTRRFGRDLVFDLSPPVVEPVVPPSAQSMNQASDCRVFVDGEVFLCRVTDQIK
ncbi:MAG: chemotaxis protein CheX [Phycisphaerales bacterium]|nr:chemotaxis protein CheX [Phycisphaerales bacterium]